MARDEDFYELAVAFPEAVLALLGATPRGPYRGHAVELKQSSRRIDVVLEPSDPADPIWLIEHCRRRDPDQDRNLLKKVVDLCCERGCWDRVRCAVVFTRAGHARAVAPAVVGDPERPHLRFAPLHVVLPEVSPETLLARGGRLLVALPLVGRAAEVEAGARSWLARLDAEPALATERARAREVFGILLSDRLSTMDVRQLLAEEDVMRHTATGRAMMAEARDEGRLAGERRVLARQLRLRLGATSPLVDRVAAASEAQLEAVADCVATERDDEALRAALDRLLPPA